MCYKSAARIIKLQPYILCSNYQKYRVITIVFVVVNEIVQEIQLVLSQAAEWFDLERSETSLFL